MKKALFFPLALAILLLSGCALSRPMHLVSGQTREIIKLMNLPNLAWAAINSSAKLPFPAKTCARLILGAIK